MVDSIGGPGGIPPELKATYKNEFQRGMSLFQQSLQQYQTADGDKKAKFKEVLDEALNVMNETAKGALDKKGQKDEIQLQKDYSKFIADESGGNLGKLNADLDKLKNDLT